MDNLNFNKWLADLKNDFPELIKTVKQTIQGNKHLPNLQSFLYWFIDRDKGFYKYFIESASRYTPKDKIRWMPLADYSKAYDYLIKEVDKKLNNYSLSEKKVFSKILADFFNEEKTKEDDNYLGWAFSTFLDFYDFDGFVYGLKTLAEYYDIYSVSINDNAPSTPQQAEPEPAKTLINSLPKYTAKEFALAYIFDKHAKKELPPTNPIEGGLAKKIIKEEKPEDCPQQPDTFYRAVKKVLEYDLNNEKDLKYISNRWLDAVKKLSKDWQQTEQYLKDKDLI